MSDVTKHELANGMTVLLKEVHSAPIICWAVLYRIGSRNERTGQTGISHWVEHMMFKATEMFPEGGRDEAVDREGGSWNAMTSTDYTTYYETLPADRIRLALEIEADRMTTTRFLADEVESERTVIISERQGAENNPLFWLDEEVSAAAFRVHGYHHEIIGDMTDLHTMTRDDLYNHYTTHYMPNNAIAVAVGDFDTDEMLALVREIYEVIPAGQLPNQFVRPEPPQRGERRVNVQRPGSTAFLQFAYHVPPATHADWFALKMLDSILSGPGGGIGNKSSRLYKALVDTGLAISVSGGLRESIDPFLYETTIVVRDGQDPATCEATYDEQIARVVDEGVSQAELDRARKQARAAYAYSMERVTSQAFSLARAENFDSYKWVERYPERLEAVTLGDIHDVARRYLRASNRVVGTFNPAEPEEAMA